MVAIEENIEVWSFMDSQLHNYFTSIDIEKDIDDCMGTATLKCPYDHNLYSYWRPIRHAIGIKGGTYDSEWLFIGRVRSTKRSGYELEIKCQDEGWKLKQQCPDDILKKWKDGESSADTIIREICDIVGLKYIIMQDKDSIIDRTKYDTDGNVVRDGNKVEQAPDPVTLLKRIQTSQNFLVSSNYKINSEDYHKLMRLLFSPSQSSQKEYEEYFANLVQEARDDLLTEIQKSKVTTQTTSGTSKESADIANTKKIVNDLARKVSSTNGYKHTFGCSSASCITNNKRGDCWAMSQYLYNHLNAKGVICKIVQYSTSSSSKHRSVLYKLNPSSSWTDFPYSKLDYNFKNTSKSKSATNVIECSLGSGKCK